MTRHRPPQEIELQVATDYASNDYRHRYREDRIDAETVIYRFDEAGRTLLALPGHGCLPAGMGSAWPDVVHAAVEAYGYGEVEVRYPVPSASAITRMDEVFRWLGLVPNIQTRRLLLLRCINHPITHKRRSWRSLGRMLGVDYRALQLWHAKGVDTIVASLNKDLIKYRVQSVQKPRFPLQRRG